MQETPENQLPTKVQYKNFEPGEFTDSLQRTFEQTIHLIETFPWEQQRDHFQAGLTNPSITIEGENHHFVKLTLNYNGSFALKTSTTRSTNQRSSS